MIELVDRPAVELPTRNEFVTRFEQRVECEQLCRMAGCDCEGRRTTFEGRHALLECTLRRVHDARVDVPENLKIEQRCRVIRIIEDVSSRLIDWRDARTGCRIRCCTRVDGKRGKAWGFVGHC